MSLQDPARIHLQDRAAVGEGIAVERLHHSQLVHVLREMREGVGTPQPGLAVLAEGATAGLKDRAGLAVAAELVVDGLAIPALQLGLVVKEIHLRRAAEHEEKDHRLGPSSSVGWFGFQWVLGEAGRFGTCAAAEKPIGFQHRGEC